MYRRLATCRRVYLLLIMVILCSFILWTSLNLQLIKRRLVYLTEGGAPSTAGEFPMNQELRIDKGIQLHETDVNHEEEMAQKHASFMSSAVAVTDVLSNNVYNDIHFRGSSTKEQYFDQRMRVSQADDEQIEFNKSHGALISYQEKRESVNQVDQHIILVKNSSIKVPSSTTDKASQTPVLSSIQDTVGKDFLISKKLKTQKHIGVYESQDKEYTEKKLNKEEIIVKDYDIKDNAENETVNDKRIQEQDIAHEGRSDVRAVVLEEKISKDEAAMDKGDGASDEKENSTEVAHEEKEVENGAFKKTGNKDRASTKKQFEENKESETPAHPRAILLVSTWRSGSSFLGELLALSMKNTFYSFEPLHGWNSNPYEDDDDDDDDDEDNRALDAQTYLHDILQCRFHPYPRQVEHMSRLGFYLRWNSRLKKACKPLRRCNDTSFVSNVCMKSSLHIAKVVRLPLMDAQALLAHLASLKVLHLTRDPRAVMNSRKDHRWCKEDICRDPDTVCRSQLLDLTFASILHRQYPDRYKFVRYEDLSLNPLEMVMNLWKFLELEITPQLVKIVKQRTTTHSKSPFTTRRMSRQHTFKWREEMHYGVMRKVQRACAPVLHLLGMRIFTSKKEFRNVSLPVMLSPIPPLLQNAKKSIEDY